jgi:DNA-binding NarL/FixJ family response regulator
MPGSASPPIAHLWIVEDVTSLRLELIDILNAEAGLHVDDAFGSMEEVEAWLARREGEMPDLVVMDIGLPGIDGIQATASLKARFPELRVVMLTSYRDPEKLLDAIQAGADAYVFKDGSIDALLDAIRAARAGGMLFPRPVAQLVKQHFASLPVRLDIRLTPREQEVLELMCNGGGTHKQMADALGISTETVGNYVRGIYTKLQVNKNQDAVAKAYRFGLIRHGAG